MFEKLCRLKANGKKGMTLMELIIAMAISAIVVASCIMLIAPSARSMALNSKMANAKSITLLIDQRIKGSMQYAKSAVITEDPLDASALGGERMQFFADANGHFIMSYGGINSEVLSEGYYDGFTVDASFKRSAGNLDAVIATITVSAEDGSVEYSLDVTVKLLNAKADGTTISTPVSGDPSTWKAISFDYII